jgi:Protein of unknown function (DUF3177)
VPPSVLLKSKAMPANSVSFRTGATALSLTAVFSAAIVLAAVPVHALTSHDALTLTKPLFEPLNAASDVATRSLVWADFRIAVALFVVAPLFLFVWSLAEQRGADDAVKRILMGYWEASSLLMLTVFLNIAEVPTAAFTGLFVQALIVVSLSYWTDLLEEVSSSNTLISRVFRLWQPAAILAAGGGVLVQLPFQGCNFAPPMTSPMCSAWLEPPMAFHRLLIPGISPETLQSLATAGCAIYFSYLAYLVTFVIPTVGRMGRKDRNMFSSVSLLRSVGLISKDSKGT